MTAKLHSPAWRPIRFHRTSLRTQRGFTMIEMLLVVAVAIVVMVLALLSFANASATFRIKNNARDIANLLNFARMKAGANFSRVVVYCDAGQTPTPCTLNYYSIDSPTTAISLSGDQKIYLSAGVSLAIPPSVAFGVGGQSAVAPSMSGGTALCGNTGATTPYCAIFNTRGIPINSFSSTAVTAFPTYAFYLTNTKGDSMAVGIDLGGNTTIYQLNGSTFTTLRD